MESLSAFFAENVIKKEDIKVIVSERFRDKSGKPIEWVIQAISAKEDEAIRKECTNRIQVPGKKGQYTNSFDSNSYLTKLAVRSVKYPNLNDKELQDSYHVMGAEQLIMAMLYKDEFDRLVDILDRESQVEDINDLVAEAKN
nr:MAG TPA: tail assembly chaperone protein [Caudoviricetes sp.]